MTRIERNDSSGEMSWVELASRIEAQEIDIKTVSPENLEFINYWRQKDPEFNVKVQIRRASRIRPPDKETKKTKPKKARRKLWGQQSFFEQISPPASREYSFEEIVSPERALENAHRAGNSPYPSPRGSVLRLDISQTKRGLKEKIGIPSARGKDPQEKRIRERIGRFFNEDGAKIIQDYDREPDRNNLSPELEVRINRVKNQISGILDSNLSLWEKKQKLRQLEEEYRKLG